MRDRFEVVHNVMEKAFQHLLKNDFYHTASQLFSYRPVHHGNKVIFELQFQVKCSKTGKTV